MKAKKGKDKEKGTEKVTVKDGKIGTLEKAGHHGGNQKDTVKAYSQYMTIMMKTI